MRREEAQIGEYYTYTCSGSNYFFYYNGQPEIMCRGCGRIMPWNRIRRVRPDETRGRNISTGNGLMDRISNAQDNTPNTSLGRISGTIGLSLPSLPSLNWDALMEERRIQMERDFLNFPTETYNDNDNEEPDMFERPWLGSDDNELPTEITPIEIELECNRCDFPHRMVVAGEGTHEANWTCRRCDLRNRKTLYIIDTGSRRNKKEPEDGTETLTDVPESRKFELRFLSEQSVKLIKEALTDGIYKLNKRTLFKIMADIFWSGFDYHENKKE